MISKILWNEIVHICIVKKRNKETLLTERTSFEYTVYSWHIKHRNHTVETFVNSEISEFSRKENPRSIMAIEIAVHTHNCINDECKRNECETKQRITYSNYIVNIHWSICVNVEAKSADIVKKGDCVITIFGNIDRSISLIQRSWN